MPSELPLIERARARPQRRAIHASEGDFDYGDLLEASGRVAAALLEAAGQEAVRLAGAPAGERVRRQAGGVAGRQVGDHARVLRPRDLAEARVAFLVPPGFCYVAVQCGIWRAGGIAVPLALSHPPPELAYVLDDTGATIVIAHADPEHALRTLTAERAIRLLTTAQLGLPFPTRPTPADLAPADRARPGAYEEPLPEQGAGRRALILYTSGTTSRPKGVVLTHGNLEAQVSALVAAWGWSAEDHILCTLPLHHVHGIVNVLACALWCGARCTILPHFDAASAWEHIEHGDFTLFMAVPTMYNRLIAAWDAASPGRRARMSAACRRMRLMVSGSAALPVSTLERWRAISGHTLLERYGMTEIGMALSNPLHGERRPGFVGTALPRVEVRLVDDKGDVTQPGAAGEIEVRGPAVFAEYWRQPDATHAAFRDGWFRTGDVAVIEDGYYRILGRSSVDIIKTGGYKVSALEIEEVLRTHPHVQECAVIGVPDDEWGERVCAAIVSAPDARLDADGIRAWAKERLAPYKVPRRVMMLAELPRNAMGKVRKGEVVKMFGSS